MNTATFSMATLAPALPEIVLLLLVLILLVVDLFLKDEEKHITYWLSILALVGTSVLILGTLGRPTVVTFQGLFVADLMSQVLKVVALLAVAATLMLGRSYLQVRGLLTGEFMCL